MVAREPQNAKDCNRVGAREIDTSAPFQSVKDAVTLFGGGTFSDGRYTIKKPNPRSAERVLAMETRHHLTQKELNKLKEKIKNTEAAKSETLLELEEAKKTVDDLTYKLKAANEHRDSAIRATEVAKNQETQYERADSLSSAALEQDLELALENYTTVFSELKAAKEELWKICQADEAEKAAETNIEKFREISSEISAVYESTGQTKVQPFCAQEETSSDDAVVEESQKKLLDLKNKFDPQQSQLAESVGQISCVKKKMENAKALDLDSVRAVASELYGAKESIQKVAEEESALRKLVESLELELESVKKEHAELTQKESETESIARDLRTQLQKAEIDLETFPEEETKGSDAFADTISETLQRLSSERENARREAEETEAKAEALRHEAEDVNIALQEVEEELRATLLEAEEANAAEKSVLERTNSFSERTDTAHTSVSKSNARITISREEFESLSRKVEESEKLADVQVEARKNAALLEKSQKEIRDIKFATMEASKKAEMAEGAKKAVEDELRRWHEREQKKAAGAASRIQAETKMSVKSSRRHSKILKQNPPKKIAEARKLEKAKTYASKIVLWPSVSGIFHRRNHDKSRYASCLPD